MPRSTHYPAIADILQASYEIEVAAQVGKLTLELPQSEQIRIDINKLKADTKSAHYVIASKKFRG